MRRDDDFLVVDEPGVSIVRNFQAVFDDLIMGLEDVTLVEVYFLLHDGKDNSDVLSY